jgi:hypothetical protein
MLHLKHLSYVPLILHLMQVQAAESFKVETGDWFLDGPSYAFTWVAGGEILVRLEVVNVSLLQPTQKGCWVISLV